MSSPDIQAGLAHLSRHASEAQRNKLENIIRTQLNPDLGGVNYPPISRLQSAHKAKAYESYFTQQDMPAFRWHMAVAARISCLKPRKDLTTLSVSNGEHLLPALLANHCDAIHWHGQFQVGNLYAVRNHIEGFNPDKYAFHSMQARLAFQGDWENLTARAEQWLATDVKHYKSYDVDQRFYIGLAKGDVVAMEDALMQLASPKYNRIRNKQDGWGLEERLFSAWGVLLAKIAYLHDFQLQLDTPWIPNEWLTNIADESLKPTYDFLDAEDIFAPFIAAGDEWCDVIALSPRPPAEKPLGLVEIKKIAGA